MASVLGYSKAGISKFTELFRSVLIREAGFSKEPPFDPRKAIEALGGTITEDNDGSLNKHSAHALLKPVEPFSERKFEIIIPVGSPIARNTFSLAHELGHLLLHLEWFDQDEWKKRCDNMKKEGLALLRRDANALEYEANHFAACFLMPEPMFLSVLGEIQLNTKDTTAAILELAERFKVSYSAAETRLKHLGVLSW